MKSFAYGELKLNKDVKEGDNESLLSLFDAAERFKPMTVLMDAKEDSLVKVIVGELGEIDLKLGADMKRQKEKTIMTLFWYEERTKKIEIQKAAQRGQLIEVRMMLI
jgi:hypothetical protein